MTRKSRNNRVVGLKPVAHSVAHCEDDVPYTLLKDGKCYFSKRAPVGLKPKSKIRLLDRTVTNGANGYVRFSIGTISRKFAKPLLLRYAAELDAMGAKLKRPVDREIYSFFAKHVHAPQLG